VKTVLEGKVPDRVPTRLRTTPEALTALEKHLGLQGDALLDRLGVDLLRVSFVYKGPKELYGGPLLGGAGRDIFGIEWKPVKNEYCTYMEAQNAPLANAASVKDIERYAWPKPEWFDPAGLAEEIDKAGAKGKRAVMLFAGDWEYYYFMRGLEQFMLDMVEHPEIIDAIARHMVRFHGDRLRQALEAGVGKSIDMVGFSGDVGAQTGMMFSPDMWRRFWKQPLADLISICQAGHLPVFYHSCGSIVPIIPDLIEIGVNVLDPIQTRAQGMQPESLKARFGDKLVFHGGVDEQELLPKGSPADVAAEVRRLVKILGKGGGYILSSSHSLQADTPPENIVAMFDAVLAT
jgi:uroporphyrinogen decarboxylase